MRRLYHGVMSSVWRRYYRVLTWVEGLRLGRLLMWGPRSKNGYPALWNKYDCTIRPWVMKRDMAAHGHWSHHYWRARCE